MSRKTKRPDKPDARTPPRAAPGALEALAAQQGVKPIANPEELYAEFWPKDETADQFVEAVHRWRREGGEGSPP